MLGNSTESILASTLAARRCNFVLKLILRKFDVANGDHPVKYILKNLKVELYEPLHIWLVEICPELGVVPPPLPVSQLN